MGLGSIGAAIVANPGISAMIRHHALLYEDLSDPVALLRGDPEAGRVRKFWTYASGGGREHEQRSDERLRNMTNSNHGTHRLLGVMAIAIQSHAAAISKPPMAPMIAHITGSIRGCRLCACRRITRTSVADTSQPVAGPSSSAAGEETHPSPMSMLRSR